MGLLKVAQKGIKTGKKIQAARAAKKGECTGCGKSVRGKKTVCSQRCAQFTAEHY